MLTLYSLCTIIMKNVHIVYTNYAKVKLLHFKIKNEKDDEKNS